MCNSAFWEIKLIDLIGTLINGFTLLFAYRIYKNFDVKKAHINKQLDTVLQLIQDINNTSIPIYFYTKVPEHILKNFSDDDKVTNNKVLDIWHHSLFGIAGFIVPDQQDVYISDDIQKVLPFLSYINNPLLPSKIAQKLNAFYSPVNNYRSFEKASNKFVEIHPGIEEGYVLRYQYPDYIDTYKSWGNFVKSTKELRMEIERWLNQYSSNDVNFNTYVQNARFNNK